MASETPSTKPYLIRALHQWCTDFGFTPFLAVFVDERVEVPMEFVKNKYMLGDEFSMLDVAIAPRCGAWSISESIFPEMLPHS